MSKSVIVHVRLRRNMVYYLIDYVYQTTEIKLIIYNNKKYYPRSNTWFDGPEKRHKYDPDIECGGYEDCEVSPTIWPKKNEEIDYVITHRPKNYFLSEELEEDKKTKTRFLKLVKTIKKVGINNIVLVGYDSIAFMNDVGVNEDHRGSDHCQVSTRFHDTYTVESPIRLMDFVKALYKIKSHKWDYHYELFCRCNTKKVDNNLTINMIFDHGS